MAKNKSKKSGYMGPAFAEFLAIFNYCEERLRAHGDNPDEVLPIQVGKLGSAVFWITQSEGAEQATECVNRLVIGWGNDAQGLRSSFKFKAEHSDLITLAKSNPNIDELEMRLPFPNCALVINNPSVDAYSLEEGQQRSVDAAIMYMETRYIDEKQPGDWYDRIGLNLGDEFYCVNIAMKMTGDPDLFLVPAEIHVKIDTALDEVKWTCGVPKGIPQKLVAGMESYGRFAVQSVATWLGALNSPQVKHDLTTGIKPGHVHTPRRKERVFYEHTVLTIDPNKPVELKDPLGHHAKHRLHPVRGFWRHYKSGKRTWVTPHWRGDKELGVVTHDYEVINTE